MLIDQNIITDIEKKLSAQHTKFDIQIFLQLLQITSRPLGYPVHEDGVNEDFYLSRLKNKLEQAQLFNQRAAVTIFDSLAQLRFCFCYCLYTLGDQKIDEELLSLLENAIDKRLYTTAEEQCAEKSLLRMLITKPKEILLLCAEHERRLQYPEIQQQIQTRIKFLKGIYEDDEPEKAQTPLIIELFQCAIQAAQVNSLFNEVKKNNQRLLGTYLLKHMPQFIDEAISNNPYLKRAVELAKLESSNSAGIEEDSIRDTPREERFFMNSSR